MSDLTLADLIDNIDAVRTNPANIQRVVTNTLQQASEGQYDVVDPSNPFVFLLEAATAVGAAGLQRNESLLRMRYPSLAQTYEELYHHMSNADYLGRFSKPGEATFTFLMDAEEIRQQTIMGDDGIRRMVIPKDTEILVEGIRFTLYYPIEIRVLPHGGFNVVWDTSYSSPLKTLETNQIDWFLTRIPGGVEGLSHIDLLRFDVPIEQVRLRSKRDQMSASSGYTKTYEFDQQFYHARVYIDYGEWEEIQTTHSNLVYDPRNITARLTHLGDQLKVHIPQIYFNRFDLDGRSIRIDIYTTQGNIDNCLDRYEPRNFQTRWRDLSKNPSEYTTPIQSFTTMTIIADDCISGGHNGMSFDDLRARIIDNAVGMIDLPITPVQLEQRVEQDGYQIVKDVDDLTSRIYKATRLIERPESSANIISPINATVHTFEAAAEDLVGNNNIYDNGDRITIGSRTLFDQNRQNGGAGPLKIVGNDVLAQLANASPMQTAQIINNNNYVYTPFHYVLDMRVNNFDVRAYYLDNPTIRTKEFVQENQSATFQVAIQQSGVTKETDGYRLAITTQSGQSFRELNDGDVHAFLSFVPKNEIERAFLQGTLQGRTENGEYVFEFFIGTNFDLDEDDNLLTNSLQISTGADTDYAIDLQGKVDVAIAVGDLGIESIEASAINDYLADFNVTGELYGLVHEKLHLHLGDPLHGLWRRARTVASGVEYERYASDIEATYQYTVFERDGDGNIVIDYDSESGEPPTYVVLHDAGDPVLDGNGDPVYAHRKGDTKLDVNGEPIEINPRKRDRQIDLLLFEASFAFVDEGSAQRYTQRTNEQLVRWIIEDIEQIADRMLENTQLWYYPESTLGDVNIMIENGINTTIRSEQSMWVTFYMTEIGHRNIELRNDLTTIAIEEIYNHLSHSTISVNAIVQAIKDRSGDEVIDVLVGGIGGESDYQTLTVLDGGTMLGIRKEMIVLADDRLTVQDDVNVDFIRHA